MLESFFFDTCYKIITGAEIYIWSLRFGVVSPKKNPQKSSGSNLTLVSYSNPQKSGSPLPHFLTNGGRCVERVRNPWQFVWPWDWKDCFPICPDKVSSTIGTLASRCQILHSYLTWTKWHYLCRHFHEELIQRVISEPIESLFTAIVYASSFNPEALHTFWWKIH